MDSNRPNFNLVILAGMIAAPPEIEDSENAGTGRLLLGVKSNNPAPRLDLIPVSTAGGRIPDGCISGDWLWIAGSLQRRFAPATGRSRIEVAAHHIEPRLFDAPIGAPR